MLMRDRTAVIYGGAGAVGSAVARAMAREGAQVFLAGRSQAKLDAVAERITTDGGTVDVAVVDALDERSVSAHLVQIADTADRIDVSFNAVGLDNGEQGLPLLELSADEYCRPITEYARTNFITAKAAGRRMSTQRSGVIITLSNPMARTPAALSGCFGQPAAAVENLTRQLAAELGPDKVRAVCLRPTGMPASVTDLDTAPGRIWRRAAERLGVEFDRMLDSIGGGTMQGRPIVPNDVAELATFVASDRARGLTGTVLNVTGGAIPD